MPCIYLYTKIRCGSATYNQIKINTGEWGICKGRSCGLKGNCDAGDVRVVTGAHITTLSNPYLALDRRQEARRQEALVADMNIIYSTIVGVENMFLQWRRTMEALPLDSWSASVKGLQSTSNT